MTQRQIDRYISPKETATLLGVSLVRVHQLATEGRLPHLSTPIGRLYPREEIEAIAATRAKQNRTRTKQTA